MPRTRGQIVNQKSPQLLGTDGVCSGSVVVVFVPSKTALNALTVQYAKELRKDNVLVNAGCPGYCATDLNNQTGHRTAAQGATIAVKLATLGPDGPTGGFFNDEGVVPW